ncbi:MAG TPA: FMN-binding protein [Trebonia sp.]|nr:FMN-binding protein [Trebonia sp.]
MRRVILAIVATAAGLVLLLSFKTHSGSGGLAASSITSPDQNGTATSPTDPSSAAGTGTTSGSSSSGSTASGSGSQTVDGNVVQTVYGPIQVDITVKGGKITAVNVPVAPDRTARDVQIGDVALPELVQETINSDSANIDAVSGASYTSQGYISSLQSAIDKAGA